MMITFTPEQEQFMQLSQTRAYYQGLREGVEMYAHWQDGVQYVGSTGTTLEQALIDINREEAGLLNRYKQLSAL